MGVHSKIPIGMTSNRFFELDVFRGLAAFGVLLYHYTSNYTGYGEHSSEMRFYFPWGRLAVELFFIISGFVIILTLDRTKKGRDFVFKRFARLYPAYWAAVILTFTIVAITKPDFKRDIKVSFFEAIVNLTMFQQLFNIPNVDPVYWTLAAELCFYVMMFFIFKLNLLKHIEKVIIVWLTVAVVLAFKTYTARWGLFSEGLEQFNLELTSQSSPVNPEVVMMGFNTLPHDILNWVKDSLRVLLNLKFAHLFIIGIVLYQIKQKGFTLSRVLILIICILQQRIVASWGDTWNETIFVALMTLTLYLATQNYLKFIVVKPLLFLGAISYPLYLVHEVIGFIIIKYLYGFHLNPYLILFTATIVTMAIATLISIFIERPSLAFLTNKHKELTSSETKQSRMEPYSNEGN